MANIISKNWQKLKDSPKNWWKNKVGDAPPAMRDLILAYAPLERIEKRHNGKIRKVPVGSYVPEAKILAQAGQLSVQIEAKKWAHKHKTKISYQTLMKSRPDLAHALYWKDGTRKTPFQLSIVPSFNKGPVQKMMEREYKYRRDHQLPLPVLVSKYRIGPDYLRDIGDAGLKLKGSPVGFKINIKNPMHKRTTQEKLLHYTGLWAAWILTITGAVAISVSNPWLFAGGAVALYLANKPGKDFSLFDVAETVYRDWGWFSDKKLRQGKFSLAKTAETLVYVTALLVAGGIAVAGAWAGMLALPCWSWLLANGLAPLAVSSLAYVTAGFFSVIAAATTYTAVTFPIRYFWGLTYYDNQEHPTRKEVKDLPVINDKKDLASSLERKYQEVLRKITKPAYKISVKDQLKLEKTITQQFKALKVNVNKAANDAQLREAPKNKKRRP